MIRRRLKSHLIRSAARHPITLISGPKGAGKTTLARETFDYPYVSLTDWKTRHFAKSDPTAFLYQHRKGAHNLVIDDIHLVPELWRPIAQIVEDRSTPGSFILLSSRVIEDQAFGDLFHRVTLLPPSLEELGLSACGGGGVEEALFRGCFPAITDTAEVHRHYSEWLGHFFEQELPRQHRVSRPESLVAFTKLCAGAIGEMVNFSRLGDNCGVSHNTGRLWLKVLMDNYLVFLLPPHHQGFGKRVVKTPKLYFYDTGLAAALLGIQSADELVTHYHRGALMESLVLSELVKERYNSGLEGGLFFWRDKLGNEVDCLIEESDQVYPVEIKAGKTVSASYFDGLNRWNELSGGDPANSRIIYAGDDDHRHPMAQVLSWRSMRRVTAAV